MGIKVEMLYTQSHHQNHSIREAKIFLKMWLLFHQYMPKIYV